MYIRKSIYMRATDMATARVFRSGNSQAVRLPKEYRFGSDEVEVFRRGDEVVLREKPRRMGSALELLMTLPEDMFTNISDKRPPQDREGM
jgi:antitoxin VapB